MPHFPEGANTGEPTEGVQAILDQTVSLRVFTLERFALKLTAVR
jgi:hypothetical protein